MKTIAKIIQICGRVENLSVSIPNEPYMRLVIEHIGTGPRGYPAISVAHYFEQNGDLCQDPERICQNWFRRNDVVMIGKGIKKFWIRMRLAAGQEGRL
jgi:hypothetical protein